MVREVVHKGHDVFDLWDQVMEASHRVPHDLRLEVDNLSKRISDIGPRPAKRAGIGVDFFGLREFDERKDPRSSISARYSELNPDRPVVIEKEREIKQKAFIWVDPRMNYASRAGIPTKKQAGMVCALVTARKLVKHDDSISIMAGGVIHRLGRNVYRAADHLGSDISIMSDAVPEVSGKVPTGSSAFFFGQFFDRDETTRLLENFADKGVGGHLIMMLDPREVEFDFADNTEIEGLNGEISANGQTSLTFSSVADMRKIWKKELSSHIEWLRAEAERHGFDLALQRTDRGLENAVIHILDDEQPDVAEQMQELGIA